SVCRRDRLYSLSWQRRHILPIYLGSATKKSHNRVNCLRFVHPGMENSQNGCSLLELRLA
ncbi:hypothetical protein, partial [Edwardsiella hoshinae]|uniref:hypothetical protein n=1 Tax=Edwardsiella hoshinae TaxID=93378 RepID=UPI001C3F358D